MTSQTCSSLRINARNSESEAMPRLTGHRASNGRSYTSLAGGREIAIATVSTIHQHFKPRVPRGNLFRCQQGRIDGASFAEESTMVGSQALRRPQISFAYHGTLRLDRDRAVNVDTGGKQLGRAPSVPRRYVVPQGGGDGGFAFHHRRANMHVTGSRATGRCDYRVMKRHLMA